VTVHRWELLRHEGDRAEFELEVSSGTYVRSLIAGLGDAYCEELERTVVGPFRLEDADPERLVAPLDALAFLPALELDSEQADAVGHGRRVGETAAGAVRLVHAGELLAIAEPRAGELQPVVVFEPR
jgi:tRNA pseudouridine55 synthase